MTKTLDIVDKRVENRLRDSTITTQDVLDDTCAAYKGVRKSPLRGN